MEKYNTFVKIEQIKEYLQTGKNEEALEVATGVDLTKVRENYHYMLLAKVFLNNGILSKAKDCYAKAYEKSPTRHVIMELANLSIRLKSLVEAERYLDEFKQIAPDNYMNYIFKYKVDRIKGKPIEDLVVSLEKLKKEEFFDNWGFELAKLYHKMGEKEKCIAACNDVIVWFGEGEYVDRAKHLRDSLTKEPIEKIFSEKMPVADDNDGYDVKNVIADLSKNVAEQIKEEAKTDSSDKKERTENGKKEAEEKSVAEKADDSSSEHIVAEGVVATEGKASENAVAVITEKAAETVTAENNKEQSGNLKNKKKKNKRKKDKLKRKENAEVSDIDSIVGEISEKVSNFDVSDLGSVNVSATAAEPIGEIKEEVPLDATRVINREEIAAKLAESEPVESENTVEEQADVQDALAEAVSELATVVQAEMDEIQVVAEKTEDELKAEIQEEETKKAEPEIDEDEELIKRLLEEETKNLAYSVKKTEKKTETATLTNTVLPVQEKSAKEDPLEEETAKATGNGSVAEAEIETGENIIEITAPADRPKEANTVLIKEADLNSSGMLDRFLESKGKRFEDYFGFFAYQQYVSEQLASMLDVMLSDKKYISYAVASDKGAGKKAIINGITKLLASAGQLESNKPVWADAANINEIDIEAKIPKLEGRSLVVDKAGNLEKKSVEKLVRMIKGHNIAVVLSDSDKNISQLLKENSDLDEVILNKMSTPKYSLQDYEDYVSYKAKSNGLVFSDEAYEIVMKRVYSIGVANEEGALAKIEKFMAKIIDNTEDRNAEAYIKSALGGEKNFSSDMILKEDIPEGIDF